MAQDIRNMREDAIRRAREMYARYVPQQFTDTNVESESAEIVNEKINDEEVTESQNSEKMQLNQDFLKELFKDKDKMLIIALIVILSQESNDNTILFALMYLLI